ncbi:MAG: SEC-C metal-binding domain-containing protein, partial [Candidatus Solibacter sp.]|nr:SEC-C metal-binding domain-containing protein [Candidatus Solibacter sp.]
RAKQETLPRYCRECAVLDMCHGGCPKDRVIPTPDGEPGLNYLCAGYRRFFTHCRPYTQRMATLAWEGQPPELLMEQLLAEERPAVSRAGRNDPCPCGSGRKFKMCCLKA